MCGELKGCLTKEGGTQHYIGLKSMIWVNLLEIPNLLCLLV